MHIFTWFDFVCAYFDDMHSLYKILCISWFFYTKNDFLCKKLNITRNTASKYLHELTTVGILIEEKIGKNKIYKNAFLYNLIKLW